MNASEDRIFTGRQSPVTRPLRFCLTVDLGLISYADAYDLQKRIVAARKSAAIDDVLLLCEHPHVITLGRSGKREHLLASDRVLQQKGVAYYATDRGGDITYHGPGQIVGYPILNLAAIRRDVGWYVRMLEEIMIRATTEFGIVAHREPGKTGVWVMPHVTAADSDGRLSGLHAEKLGAIGVHLSRWVTSHGFAYNVSTDLRYFDLIVPCGISGRKATSLEKLVARRVNRGVASAGLTRHFGEVLGLETIFTSREELFESLKKFEQKPVAIPA